jgi:hypothetical protein
MPVGCSQSQFHQMIDLYRQGEWLVIYTEGHVLPRMNQERQARGWKTTDSVGEDRRDSWLSSALRLVSYHPLPEVVEVIDWLFSSCGGYIPMSVVDDERLRQHDLKVTRLQLVVDHYAELRSKMTTGKVTPLPAAKNIADQHHRRPIPSRQPLTEEERDVQAAELVSAFTEFRASCGDRRITDFRTQSWAKTFKIMLDRHPFEDINAVIAALMDCPQYVDQQRYFDAYDLNRPGEWSSLMATVEIHKAVRTSANMAPRATARRSDGAIHHQSDAVTGINAATKSTGGTKKTDDR